MRVLHVSGQFYPDYGGDGIYYARLIAETKPYGIAHEQLAVRTVHPDGLRELTRDGLRIHYLGRQFRRWGSLAVFFWVASRLRSFDLLHIHSHVDRYFLTYCLVRLCGKRTIYSASLEDSALDLVDGYRPRFRRLARLLLRTIGTFIVISPRLLSRSLRVVSRDRVRLIPQGVSLETPRPDAAARLALRKTHGIQPDDVVLLNVGSICERKNTLYLVEALSRIDQPRVKLVIVGPVLEEGYAARVTAAIARHNLQDRVHLAGFQCDPTPFYSMADICVLSSLSEGFPNTILEAMACHLPVVSSHLPGLVEFVIQHGKTGFFTNSFEDYVRHLAWLVDHPRERMDMGDRGREVVVRNFAMSGVVNMYVDTYKSDRAALQPPKTHAEGFDVPLCHDVARSAETLSPIRMPASSRPQLMIVVDTEAEFDWSKGVQDDRGRVSAIASLHRMVDLLEEFGAKGCFVADYPVLSDTRGGDLMRALGEDGHDVGVHMQGWTTPPCVFASEEWLTFSGNLGPALEAEKLIRHTETLVEITGRRPTTFKAGRYGVSPGTWRTLARLGFEIDLSVCPHYDFSTAGGPDFRRFDSHPSWIGQPGSLLELPTTAGLSGHVGKLASNLGGLFLPSGRRRDFDDFLARSKALHPRRLSPEGCSFGELAALTNSLYAGGLRLFTLSLHSPSLQAGNTPYTRTDSDVDHMLQTIRRYLEFFRDDLGGTFTTPPAFLRHIRTMEEMPAEQDGRVAELVLARR